MDNQGLVKHLIEKLRGITLAVQIMPFIYSALYIVALILYLFASDSTMAILDTLMFISPAVVIGNLVESRILELCNWHKTACMIPLFPQINILIDRYVYEFSENAARVHLIIIGIMLLLFLICAYKVFFSNGRK